MGAKTLVTGILLLVACGTLCGEPAPPPPANIVVTISLVPGTKDTCQQVVTGSSPNDFPGVSRNRGDIVTFRGTTASGFAVQFPGSGSSLPFSKSTFHHGDKSGKATGAPNRYPYGKVTVPGPHGTVTC